MAKIKVEPEEEFYEMENECPNCGKELPEVTEWNQVYLDTDTGFVTIKSVCICGVEVERFYDYNRTVIYGIPTRREPEQKHCPECGCFMKYCCVPADTYYLPEDAPPDEFWYCKRCETTIDIRVK